MSGEASTGYLRDMHTLFDSGTASGLSDRQLLERFTGGGGPSSETAFEVLVERHGPMVMRVCRSTLGQEQADVHDAFQATFLVLARKSKTIRRLDSVGSWLFGVASRVARRARVEAARRRRAEREGGLRLAATVDDGTHGALAEDLGKLLQAEVERLPDHLRAVVVLCYWEGLTHEQAAARLACPLGTVRSRVARARDLLHCRLSRRGLGPVAGAVTAAFDSPDFLKATAVEIPATLVSATAAIAKQVASGGSLAQLTSPSVRTLVQNVIGSMFMTKLRMTAVCLLLVAGGVYGLTLAAPQVQGVPKGQRERAPVAKSAKSKTQPPVRLMREYVVEPPDLLIVEVLEALPGRPISGERLVRPDGAISLGFYGDVHVAGLTLSQVKEKIVLHLRRFVDDTTLGLVVLDETDDGSLPPTDPTEIPEVPMGRNPFEASKGDAKEHKKAPSLESFRPVAPGAANPFDVDSAPSASTHGEATQPRPPVPEPRADANPIDVDSPPAKRRLVEPKDTDRVFVDVTAYNSKNYYIQGEFVSPGRLPVTGQERVLDAVNFANGLTAEADHDRVVVYRQPEGGGPVHTLKVDIDQIMLGDDLSTNYQLRSGDRLVARSRDDARRTTQEAEPRRSTSGPKPVAEAPRFNRERDTASRPFEAAPERPFAADERRSFERLEKRIADLERKLDVILETLKRTAH